MNSVRGQDKTPGEFRLDQDWIGKARFSTRRRRATAAAALRLHACDAEGIAVQLRALVAHADIDELDQ